MGQIETNNYLNRVVSGGSDSGTRQSAQVADKAAFSKALSSAVNNNSSANSAVQTTSTLESIFQKASKTYGVDVNLLKAVAKAESNFNPQAVSSCGAQGVMQLMPATSKELGVTDPFDAEQNIMGGAKCLKQKLDEFGDIDLALAAYNAGSGAVKKFGGIPPYKETQNYVKKVKSYYNESYDLSSVKVSTSAQSESAGSAVAAQSQSAEKTTAASSNMSTAAVISALSTYAQMSAMMSSSASSSSAMLGGISSLTSNLLSESVASMMQNIISGGEASVTASDYNKFIELLALQMQQSVLMSFGDSDDSGFGGGDYMSSFSTNYMMGTLMSYLGSLSSSSALDSGDSEAKNEIVQALNNTSSLSGAYTASEYVNLMSSIL